MHCRLQQKFTKPRCTTVFKLGACTSTLSQGNCSGRLPAAWVPLSASKARSYKTPSAENALLHQSTFCLTS